MKPESLDAPPSFFYEVDEGTPLHLTVKFFSFHQRGGGIKVVFFFIESSPRALM